MKKNINYGFTLSRRYSTLQIVIRVVIIFLVIAITKSVGANPIMSHRPAADPNPFIHDGRLYVIASNDAYNTVGYSIRGYVLVSTTDMKNWLDHGEVFQVPRDASWANRAFAPGAISKNGKIYLYFPDGGNSIGVAVADGPEGPYVDPLGKALITRSTPGANVPWLFDPMVFVDDDGSAYVYFGGGPPDGNPPAGENLRVIKLGEDMISVEGTAVTIEAPYSFEASFVHKRNGTYYFTYSTNFEQGSARIDYLTSDDPLTGFTHIGTVLDNPTIAGSNINTWNNNHHGIIEYEDTWYIFYHDRRVSGTTYKRNISVELLHHNEDGTIRRIREVTQNGPPQIRNFNPFQTVRATTINRQSGTEVESSPETGTMVTSINNNDWIRLLGVDFDNGATKFEARVASGSNGGSIEIRTGSRTGPLVGTLEVPSTGGWNTWQTLTTDITGLSGVHNLYFVFRGTGTDNLFNWTWWKFHPDEPVSTSSLDDMRELDSYGYSVLAAPNPFVSDVTIMNQAPLSTEKLKVEIYNIKGEKIYQATAAGNGETRIEESAKWRSGIYYIVLSNTTGIVSVSPMLKGN
jgi:arabinoxylan arabinofuranohydrolase